LIQLADLRLPDFRRPGDLFHALLRTLRL
jgi:hypothetical protein